MAYKRIKSTRNKQWLTKDQTFRIKRAEIRAANKSKDRKLRNETLSKQTSLIGTLGDLANKRKELNNQKYSRKMDYKTAKLNYKQSRNKIGMLKAAMQGSAQNIGSLGMSGAALSYVNQQGSAVDNANKLVGGGNTDTINNTTDKRQEDVYGDYRE